MDAEARATTLIGEIPLWAPRVAGPRVLDIGSGNGSPGLVLALLRADLAVTLLEPRLKRWAFLREAIRTTGARAEAVRSRHDQYQGPLVDAVVLRGLRIEGAELRCLLKPGGQWIQVGARPEAGPGFAPLETWGPQVHVARGCFT